MIKGVLFDLDGTLLQTEILSDRAVIKAFGESLPSDVRDKLLAEGGWVLPWELKKATLGLRGPDWIPMVIQYGQEHWGVKDYNPGEEKEPMSGIPPPPPMIEFMESWESNLCELCAHVDECPGATELVEQLSKTDLSLAIATSSRQSSVIKKRLKHESMFNKMKTIVTGDDPAVKNGKPSPDIFIEAARRLGLDPSECIVFEDAVSGVEAGKAAGCVVVAVPDARMDKKLFEPIADVVLDDLMQFDGTPWGINVNMKSLVREYV